MNQDSNPKISSGAETKCETCDGERPCAHIEHDAVAKNYQMQLTYKDTHDFFHELLGPYTLVSEDWKVDNLNSVKILQEIINAATERLVHVTHAKKRKRNALKVDLKKAKAKLAEECESAKRARLQLDVYKDSMLKVVHLRANETVEITTIDKSSD